MKTSLLSLLLLLPLALHAETELFRDPSQPLDRRVADLVGRLTLEEKAALLNHKGPTVERFQIRSDQWNQCLNGVKWDRPTTLFPACIAMAATWDPSLVREVASTLSDEARAIYNGWHLDPKAAGEHKGLIYRAPVINIGRNPYWGRNHEAFGEDPFLTGRMAVAYVHGLQGDDPRFLKIASTLKHYAVNNVETDRTKLNAEVSMRMLREYWLPHFHDAVVEGHAQSLMASYNAINGTPNNINHWLLTTVLKEEWHHEGFVVSDLGGVKTMVTGHEGGKMDYVDAVAQSVMAGCDFSDQEFEKFIPAAVRSGKLSEQRLDDALTRVLRVRMRLGEFDPIQSNPYSTISPSVIDSAPHRALARRLAEQSIVLLQNRDHLLPLDKAKIRRLAVLGPLSDQLITNNYNGKVGEFVIPLQGIRNAVGPATEVLHTRGCEVIDAGQGVRLDREAGFSAGESVKFEAAAPGDYIEFAVNIPSPGTYSIKLLYKSFPSRGTYQLAVDGETQGDSVDFYAPAGAYQQSVSFGSRTFTTSGLRKFRFTVVGKNDASDAFTGHFDQLILSGPGELALEAEKLKYLTHLGSASEIARAADLARQADAALVFIGTNDQVEQEGRDRKTLGLTGQQEQLVKAVLAANPRTVVIEMSAGPLTAPWLKENVPALLQAWWPGEEGGNAIARVLFGQVNPAGRLPHTVYASEQQVPPNTEYDVTRGFTYMYLNGEPLFPFGHGLSYTEFGYDRLQLAPRELPASGSIQASIEITNRGSLEGDEVVQLYVHEIHPAVKRPNRELRGFQRLHLAPGEKRVVTFTIPAEKLAFFDEAAGAFVVRPGAYQVAIGASSSDIRATGEIVIRD